MMRILFGSLLLIGLLLAAAVRLTGQTGHWTYSGESGPERWHRLAPEFRACEGKNQSPIDLADFIEADLEPIRFSYHAGGNVIVNSGHGVQVNYAPGSSMTVDDSQFRLDQFHFHAPSENRIKGQSYAMEAHLVHVDKAGNLAVVALMFEEGRQNTVLTPLWSMLPDAAGKQHRLPVPFDAARLLPARRDYYRFNGSLTTPPCTEGVRWLVLKRPVSASKEQVVALSKVLGHSNNRPVQPVNARPVLQ